MMSRNLPSVSGPLDHYSAEVARFPVLSREAEHALALRYYEHGDRKAAEALVLANLRFVIKVAFEYRAYGFRMSELIQEGNVGLLMAVKKFNPHKGTRLITYAVWWIKATIQNFILRSWSLVRIGTTQAQRRLFYKLKASKRKLLEKLGGGEALDDWGTQELAAKFDLKPEEVTAMDQRLSTRDLSLDRPLGDDSETTHLELLSAPATQEEVVAKQEEQDLVQAKINGALKGLDPRESFIVTHRLMSDSPMTLQEIGNHYGISRERARQLEARTIKKLKTELADLQAAA